MIYVYDHAVMPLGIFYSKDMLIMIKLITETSKNRSIHLNTVHWAFGNSQCLLFIPSSLNLSTCWSRGLSVSATQQHTKIMPEILVS